MCVCACVCVRVCVCVCKKGLAWERCSVRERERKREREWEGVEKECYTLIFNSTTHFKYLGTKSLGTVTWKDAKTEYERENYK